MPVFGNDKAYTALLPRSDDDAYLEKRRAQTLSPARD
jgi:hypothetical protein